MDRMTNMLMEIDGEWHILVCGNRMRLTLGLQLQHSGHIERIHVMANMYQIYCTVYKFHKTDFLNK